VGIQRFSNTYGPLIEAFRGDGLGDDRTIQERPLFCHSRNLLSGIQRFLLFLFVLLLVIIGMSPPIVWIPDRDIQE